MGDIHAFAAATNVTVIGGADLGVGIGGWISGGGHGPLTAKYGMGADQVLEMEVVTANGDLLVVNELEDADLFWALRGVGKLVISRDSHAMRGAVLTCDYRAARAPLL